MKQCAYKIHECTQLALEGYNYCYHHILQDKNAPFKQCAYVSSMNQNRCHLPAVKRKKNKGYCNEHALQPHLVKSKCSSHCQLPRTAEVLLHSLSHYIKKPTICTSTQGSDGDHNIPDEGDGIVTKSLDPFVDIDSSVMLASGSGILNLCSESESDVDANSYRSLWNDAHAESSENESIDSDQEEVLKLGNVYSADEIVLITRAKLIRLQSLYTEQCQNLHHRLGESRRRYLHSLKQEKRIHCSITNQIHNSPKEQRMYKKLKAYNSYHKKHGVETICKQREHKCRLKVTEGLDFKPPKVSKCIFTEGGVKCGEQALPITKHCRKHILEDPNQVLFRSCSKVTGDVECITPVEAIFGDANCRLHMDIPLVRSYSRVRIQMVTTPNRNVKTEDIDIAMGIIPAEALEINNALLKQEYIKMEDPSEGLNLVNPPTDCEMAIDNQSGMQVNCDDVENSPLYSEMETSVGVADTENVKYYATEEVVGASPPTDCKMALVIDNLSGMQVNSDDVKNSPLHSEMETSVGVADTENVKYYATEEVVGDLQFTEPIVEIENPVLGLAPAAEMD